MYFTYVSNEQVTTKTTTYALSQTNTAEMQVYTQLEM